MVIAWIFAFLAIVFVWLLYKKLSGKILPGIPGPRGLPLIGSLMDLDRLRPHITLGEWGERFGGVYQVRVLSEQWVIVTSYEELNEMMLTKGYSFAGRQLNFRVKVYSNNGRNIFGGEPTMDFWTPTRKSIHNSLSKFGDGQTNIDLILATLAENLINDLNKLKGQPTDVRKIIYKYIVSVLFTVFTGTITEPGSERLEVAKFAEESIIKAIGPGSAPELDVFPWLSYFGHPTYQLLQNGMQTVDKLWKAMWPESLQTYESKNEATCVFHTMAQLIDPQSKHFLPMLTEDDLKSVFVDLIIGGITTSAFSAYSLLNLFLHYPQVLEKLQTEVDTVVGNSRRPNLTDKESMPYTMAVVYELLRYNSLVPVIGRKTLEDTTLGKYKLPKGTVVIPHFWALHHDEKFWGDSWTFRPERFLDANGQLLPYNDPVRKHLMPFGSGMRNCVGQLLALRRLFIFTAYIAQSFDVAPGDKELVSCDPRVFEIGVVLSPLDFRVKLIQRKL